jgi:hypothetical protein
MKLYNLFKLTLILPEFVYCSRNEYKEFYDDYNLIRSEIDLKNTTNTTDFSPATEQYQDYDYYYHYYDYYDVISSEIKSMKSTSDNP